jgi:choline dehydrogenase-like flavoprotein
MYRLLHYPGRQPMPYAPAAEPGKRYASLFCALMHPLSRGTVHITSADPLVPPAIDPNYFANEVDLDLLTNTVAFALKLYGTEPLAQHVKKVIIPFAEHIARGKEGLKDYVKENCGPEYHPVGSASMLPLADGGVVDPSLKVYGTSNLRVVSLRSFF